MMKESINVGGKREHTRRVGVACILSLSLSHSLSSSVLVYIIIIRCTHVSKGKTECKDNSCKHSIRKKNVDWFSFVCCSYIYAHTCAGLYVKPFNWL
jgi:hypothetical protein